MSVVMASIIRLGVNSLCVTHQLGPKTAGDFTVSSMKCCVSE